MEYMIWSMMLPNCPGKWDASQRPSRISRDSTRKSEEVKTSQSSSSSSPSSSSLTLQACCCNQHIGRCRFSFDKILPRLVLNRLLWEHFIFGHTGAWLWSGMYFFDYGNAFLLEARRAGADVSKKGQVGFSHHHISLSVFNCLGESFPQNPHRLRGQHCSGIPAMCKISWEIFSPSALDLSGGHL